MLGPDLVINSAVVGTDLSLTMVAPGETPHAHFLRAKMRIALRRYLEAMEQTKHVMNAYERLGENPQRHRDWLTNALLGEEDQRIVVATTKERMYARAVQVYAAAYHVEMAAAGGREQA